MVVLQREGVSESRKEIGLEEGDVRMIDGSSGRYRHGMEEVKEMEGRIEDCKVKEG